jgi:hypothetical protein
MRTAARPGRVVTRAALAGAGLAGLVWAASAGAGTGAFGQQADGPARVEVQDPGRSRLPVVAEHRYRMSAKIRPLLLFWVGRDNVGGARLRWRRGEEDTRGYDILIGSDPARAPRQINRWGYILEESRGREASVVGVMKKSDEESLDQAKAGVANEGQTGFYFKMVVAKSSSQESVATVTLTRVGRDYSYRELDTLLDALVAHPGAPTVRTVREPPGARAGLLTALDDLLQDGVAAARRDRRAPGRTSLAYAYYGKQYDVTRVASKLVDSAKFGGTTYRGLIEAEFELRARGGSSAESFTITCAVDGPLAGVPVYVAYQPKWWFKAELVLDARETF